MEESKDKLDHLLDSGDVDKAMQMAFALLSSAEETNDTQTDSVSIKPIARVKQKAKPVIFKSCGTSNFAVP